MDLSELERLTKQNEVADILRRAKALIDRPEKWFGPRPVGPFTGIARNCAGTAIHAAAGLPMILDSKNWEHPACVFFGKVACGDGRGVASWNNAPERTHAEVMAAFDAAIALAERS